MEYKKMDIERLHCTNKKVLLNLIKEKGKISRSELSKTTGLTPPSITRIVDEIVYNDNLAEYIGTGRSNGGRPPMIVKFKNTGNYIIGIDLGATYIRGGLVDLNANFISEIQVPTEINKGFASIIEKVTQVIEKLQNRKETLNEPHSKIWGVGIGVAGLVDNKTGLIESSPDFGWINVDFRKELQNKINIPFFYDNSTRLMALGELQLGDRKKLKNFAVINVGYGIASGLVIEGVLAKGFNGFAGEFGHISVDTNSKIQCKCGMYGCLEALASGHRIAELGKNILKENDSEILHNLCNGNPNFITAEIVAKAAKMGDKGCMHIYDDISEYLAKGIGVIANLLNPQIVYLGGGVSLNGQFLFDLIHEKKAKYILKSNFDIPIIPTTFGEHSTTIGAVALVLDKIMSLDL